MTQGIRKFESANTDRERSNVTAVQPHGTQVGIGVGGEQTLPVSQDDCTPPKPIPDLPLSVDKPASTGIDATVPTPTKASEEATASDSSANDATLMTPSNQTPGMADKRLLRQPRAKSVRPQTPMANPKGATGPKTEAGKRRASQNSYKEGFYARRLFPTAKQWLEDGKDYQAIAVGAHEYYKPVGFWEMFWVEQIVTHALRNARAIGHQQSVLSSVYRFVGTQLNTAQRHESAAFRRMLQAIEMLESIQARRKADSGQLQPPGSDCEQVSEGFNSSASVTSEPSEILAGDADENEKHAEASGQEDLADASRAAEEQGANGFLYGGPSDSEVVSSSQQGQGAGKTGQSRKGYGSKPQSSESYPGGGSVRKAASVLQHPLADFFDRMDQRDPQPERFPNSARDANVGTKSNGSLVKEPPKANSKGDPDVN